MDGGKDYRSVGKEKRAKRDRCIPPEWELMEPKGKALDAVETCGLLSLRELQITRENDAVDIVKKIQARQYSATEVTMAFCKRAAIAQQLTNCLTEILFDQAIARARALDAEQAADPDAPLRPLHGLPISLKDSFRLPGVDASIGFIYLANQPDTLLSALPRLLLDLGAVVYCKTNVPQTMMTADSDNHVFGRTLNPANPKLTAGGSSGGEGALIAMRGSVIGIGTDIAGSIRIPSLCNGIYGIRPSAGIIPFSGQSDPVPDGMTGIEPVAGPMATSLRACAFLLKTVTEAQPWTYDHDCLHFRWQGSSLLRRIRVGLVSNDGMYTPWPPVRRALYQAAQKLESAGVEMIPLALPHWPEAFVTAIGFYTLDGGKHVAKAYEMGGEPPIESVKRKGTVQLVAADLEEFFRLNDARKRIQKAYQSLWLENRLDAIMLPPAPTTATPIDEWDSITYTSVWNLLDYPAAVIPVGKIEKCDSADEIDNASFGERDQQNYRLYTGADYYEGAATAVQVVGMRQEDEQFLDVCEKIDQILNHTG